jgi:hypothetical protein
MFQELQTLESFNGVLLSSSPNTHRPLMMLNGVLLGSNATHTQAVNDVPRVANPRKAQWGIFRFQCKHT